MQEHAAVFRDGPTLQEGCKKIAAMWPELKELKVCYCSCTGWTKKRSILEVTVIRVKTDEM